MNRFVVASLALVAFAAGMANAASTGAISGSKHDFSAASWNGTGEICKPCHIPHYAKSTDVSVALWNRTLPSADYTIRSYTDKTTNLATTKSPISSFDGRTRLCLSCHDGTIGLDTFFGNVAGTPTKTMGDISVSSNLGNDLSNDHPLGGNAVTKLQTDLFASTSNGRTSYYYKAPSGNSSGLALAEYPATGSGNYTIGCGTCHQTHPTTGGADSSEFFLRKANAKSALCQSCHEK